MLGEGVGPQDDQVSPLRLVLPLIPPPAERPRRHPRDVPLGRDPAQPFRRPREGAKPGEGVDQRCRTRPRHHPEPHRQPPHRVVRGRTAPPGVVVVEELRLVRGHVDLHRAVRPAALAGQAQVQRVPDLGRAPAVGHDLTGEHLVQQPGTPTRGVLLLARRPEGRAHDGGAGHRRRTALGDAHAAPHRRREVTPVGGIAEGDVDGLTWQDGETETGVEGRGAYQHSGVEQVVRVPHALHPLEEAHHLLPVHPGQQLRPRLPVPVLSGQRPAVRHHQLRELLREAAEPGDAGLRQQVEIDPDVDTAVPEVPVRRAAQPVRRHQRAEVAQIRPKTGGRHRAVLPPRPRLTAVRHPRRRTARVLPDPPQRPLSRRVGDHQGVDDVGRPHDRFRTRAGLAR